MFKLAIGTQTGASAGTHFGSYNYLNLVTVIPKLKTKIITGAFGATNSFFGPEDRSFLFPQEEDIGIQTGIEHPLLDEKLLLVAENISGSHSLGETTLGAAYYVTDHWMLSLGYQFSNPGSKAVNASVIEFTYVPEGGHHKKTFRHGHK
ncbi:MAG: hypothetical protein K2U26_20740 [Cyclobacteriaceae bacterium]|nr:hypothetical protein [Cyclobacteriaceae bacterium]